MASLIDVHIRKDEKYEVEGMRFERGTYTKEFSNVRVIVVGRNGVTAEITFFMYPGEKTSQFVRQMTQALLKIDHEDVLQVLAKSCYSSKISPI